MRFHEGPGGRDASGEAGRTPGAAEGDLRELYLLFTKLGFVAFGGPAAHVAMMRDEVVTRRKWMGDQEFLDLNGAINLMPGPGCSVWLGRAVSSSPPTTTTLRRGSSCW